MDRYPMRSVKVQEKKLQVGIDHYTFYIINLSSILLLTNCWEKSSPHISYSLACPQLQPNNSLTIKERVIIHQQFSGLKEVYSNTEPLNHHLPDLPGHWPHANNHTICLLSVPPSHWMNTSVRPLERITLGLPHNPNQKNPSSLKKRQKTDCTVITKDSMKSSLSTRTPYFLPGFTYTFWSIFVDGSRFSFMKFRPA